MCVDVELVCEPVAVVIPFSSGQVFRHDVRKALPRVAARGVVIPFSSGQVFRQEFEQNPLIVDIAIELES